MAAASACRSPRRHQQAFEDIDGFSHAGVGKWQREAACDSLDASSGAEALRRIATGNEQRKCPQVANAPAESSLEQC
ncbi:hypothetical protein [Methylocapsa palsarum]|uniref:hypothetical protein n=1 Tax=Methylocapsa palsarum TaxID=1612308 RepID=UPI000B84A33A|nr:hypothetical protein [Methylocapsa palsarum]